MSYPHLAGALLVACASWPAAAQARCIAAIRPTYLVADPRARLDALRAPESAPSDVLHDAVACIATSDDTDARGLHFRAAWPELMVQANAGVPDARGGGALWAGRGANALLRSGLLADYGRLHAALVPEVLGSENRPFEIFPSDNPERSSFASPFYSSNTISADLPSRMGAEPIRQVGLGQSALWVSFAHASAGISASEQMWGTGRDGLLLGRNAAGVPRYFVRVDEPIKSRAGQWSGAWFTGQLTESRFFDRDPSNDTRDLSAVALTWTPPNSRLLSVTLAHAVARVRVPGTSMVHSSALAFTPGTGNGEDAMTSALTQVRLPGAGIRAWAELAHQGGLRLRELLTVPTAELAYRVGVESAVQWHRGTWMLLAEAANAEQSQDILDRRSHDFYTGYGTPQGWTQHGQPLGDAIGPGGQTQYLAADWIASGWRAGAFGERLRVNEDALFRQYLAYPNRHDVTMRGGLRLGYGTTLYDISLEASAGTRLNYLFQNTTFLYGFRTVDIPVRELRLIMTPTVRARR